MATTTGFVQRLTWLTSGHTACFWIGSSPTSTDLFVVQFAGGDSEAQTRFKQSMVALAAEALFAGRKVNVGHPDGSGQATSVSTTACSTTTTPLQVDAVEVTQAVQDLSHAIPFFAGKRTVVRVYLSNYGSTPVTVRASLSIRRSPSDTPVAVASENTVVLDPAHAGDIPAKREVVGRSLNFVLPASHVQEGPLRILLTSVTDAVTENTVSFGCERRPIVWFHATAPVRVRVVGVRYVQSEITHTPSELDFDLIRSWLQRAMPAGQVIMSTAIVDVAASVPFNSGDINAQVAAIRALDVSGGTDARTHYYGLVSDGGFFMRGGAAGIPPTPQPGTVASGPTGNGTWGWDTDGSYGDWYTGHELGHTYGRHHPGFCGETESDLDNYPFANGQLANSNESFAGFDVGDPGNALAMAALPGTQWHDVMTYCSFQWLSAYTYLGVRRRLAAEEALPAGPEPASGPPGLLASGGRPDRRFPHLTPPSPQAALNLGGEQPPSEAVLVSVVATANLTRREGEIRFVNPLERATAIDLPESSPAHLRVVGDGGQVLGDHPVEVKLNSELEASDDRTGIIDVVLAVASSARAIELVFDGAVADTYRIGGGAPTTGALPMGALRVADAGDDDIDIVLDTAAADDAWTYSLQVSTDGGQTWQTLGVGLRKPSVTLDRRQFKQGQEVVVRVVATDGLKRSVVATERVRV